MTVFGMPESMFLVFLATLLAGSLGALHYAIVHIILGKPINEVKKDHTMEGNGSRRDRTTDGGRTDGRS